MTFVEAFEKIKKSSRKDIVDYKDCAIQVKLIDDDAHGIMYIAVRNSVVHIEPYDYVDNDATIEILSKDLVRILSGRLKLGTAIQKELVKISGNIESIDVFNVIVNKITHSKT